MSLPPISLVVLDTETTGFVPGTHRVIEFASMRCEGGEVVDTYEQLINIGEEIPDVIRVLTHITDADLAEQPSMTELIETINEHIGSDTIIVGQNVSYDIGMLKAEGIDLSDRPWIDTSMLASVLFPEFASYSLGYMSSVLSLDHHPVHRALGDVRATLELLSKCWERLQELPATKVKEAQEIMNRSAPGYKQLFECLEGKGTKDPAWLKMPEVKVDTKVKLPKIEVPVPEVGTVDLMDEPIEAQTLQSIVDNAAKSDGNTHWIAVKNLEATMQRIALPKNAKVLHPGFLMLDSKSGEELIKQKELSADEATLALKLLWYSPKTQSDLPLHGEEKTIWAGKLSCNHESPDYVAQFKDSANAVLIDHRQLLTILSDEKHPAFKLLKPEDHIVIDDASMLEDTATKAYGYYCKLPDLRAAAAGIANVTSFLDALQIWIERVREFQDIRYFAPNDLESKDVAGLKERLTELLNDSEVPEKLKSNLEHLEKILDPSLLKERIVYFEQGYDGNQYLHSVPERIGTFLRDHLYNTYRTSLLIPPGSAEFLSEILPPEVNTKHYARPNGIKHQFAIDYPEDLSMEQLLTDVPEGKTIVLTGSKRSIDDIFMGYAEQLEEQGVELICQGFSGGMNRTQAAFIAAKAPAVWILTPWAYEGVHLPAGTVNTLVMTALPFDHPGHAILSRRAEHYRDPFNEYSLPRMLQRVFRILRTFSSHCSEESEVLLTDKRIEQKGYGKSVVSYLKYLMGTEDEETDNKNKDKPENWQLNLFE